MERDPAGSPEPQPTPPAPGELLGSGTRERGQRRPHRPHPPALQPIPPALRRITTPLRRPRVTRTARLAAPALGVLAVVAGVTVLRAHTPPPHATPRPAVVTTAPPAPPGSGLTLSDYVELHHHSVAPDTAPAPASAPGDPPATRR